MINQKGMRALLCGFATATILSSYAPVARAQTVSDGHLSYAIGAVRFLETPRKVMMFRGAHLLGSSVIQPGGWLLPTIGVSDNGHIHWGSQVFDSASGDPLATPNAAKCLTKISQLPGMLTAIYGNRLIVVSPVNDAEGRTVAYTNEIRQHPGCKATEHRQISQTDIDHFFELGAVKSGLWLLGSAADGTLLVRKWSSGWMRVTPPSNVNGMLSAHWSSDGRLWVLANELNGDSVKPTLFVTDNLGKTWTSRPFSRAGLPNNWLEALRQLSAAEPTQ